MNKRRYDLVMYLRLRAEPDHPDREVLEKAAAEILELDEYLMSMRRMIIRSQEEKPE